MKKFLIAALAALCLAGCASVPMADAAADAEAKKFVPPADKAGVYIYRNTNFGGAIKMPVSIDGEQIGVTGGRVYLYKEIDPGNHIVVSKAENTESLVIEVEKGKLYYVWQQVRMGAWKARCSLFLKDEAEGQKGVNETKLGLTK